MVGPEAGEESQNSIRERLELVRSRIAAAAERSGRAPEEITLVAVTKGVEISRIREAVRLGLSHLGENWVQEALPKVESLGLPVTWHFVGHLQTNKVKEVVPRFGLIHSLDRDSLAAELVKRAPSAAGGVLEALLEVNVAEESTKQGVSVEEAVSFLRKWAGRPQLRILGLMTIAPQVEDPEMVRPLFKRLRELASEIEAEKIPGVSTKILSMGMSGDYEVAIEEGATMIRLGTSIFGARPH